MSLRRRNGSNRSQMRRERASIDPASFLVVILTAVAALTSVVILVIDHYNRVSEPLIFLSSALLLGSVVLLCSLGLVANRARETAARAEAIRSASVEAASYGVITTAAEGIILAWNQAATGICGS